MTGHPLRSPLYAALFFLVSIFLGCDSAPRKGDSSSLPIGVSDSEILIGSSLALSGHAKYLGIQTLRGALCYINHVNDTGGVHGRKITVTAYDDAYDPPHCLVNTQRLIVENQVFSLFCYVGTPTTVKILPLVEKASIPLLGMFTGANALRVPFNPHVINVRASYYQETAAAVKHLVEDLGIRDIAVFYQYDAYGFDGLTGTELALKNYGLAPVARGSYIRGTTDITEGLSKIIESNASAVVMIGTYEPCARFIRQAQKRKYSPLFYNVSFVGGEELARRLKSEANALVILSQVVPPPEMPDSASNQGYRSDYPALLRRYYPEDKPTFIGLEGYFNAQVLVEGLRRAGRNLTRESFIQAIESMNSFPLAENLNVSFSAADHQGLDQVFFTRIANGKSSLIRNWGSIKKLMAPEVKR